MTIAAEMPFELVRRADGSWRGSWSAQKLFIRVAGTEHAPDAALLTTLRGVVSRWSELREAIAAFARALGADELVPLDPSSLGGFAAASCRFDEQLVFSTIAITEASAPHRVRVTFYTGYPDGYATFEVVLDDGAPKSISAFAS